METGPRWAEEQVRGAG